MATRAQKCVKVVAASTHNVILPKCVKTLWMGVSASARLSLHVSQVLNCELVEGVICLHLTTAMVFKTSQIRTCVEIPNLKTLDLRKMTVTDMKLPVAAHYEHLN